MSNRMSPVATLFVESMSVSASLLLPLDQFSREELDGLVGSRLEQLRQRARERNA